MRSLHPRSVPGRRAGIRAWVLALFVLAGHAALGAAAADVSTGGVPSFRNDVVPVLSQAGCNSGGCHGALAGKGGFRLSLFGYDPEADYRAITRESRGRRVEVADPARSLLLTKPTAALKHKGGKRFDVDSEEYRVLAAWIAADCPPPRADDPVLTELKVLPDRARLEAGRKVSLAVEAVFGDGSRRDVTRWTRFASADETVASVDRAGNVTVLGPGEGAVTAWFSSRIALSRITAPFPHAVSEVAGAAFPVANPVDEWVNEKLRQLNLRPSPPASDGVFVRRAFLDTIGKLPTPEEVLAFVRDTSPRKHERLADQLLARPEFIDYWTYKWSDLLLVSGAKLRPDAVDAYYRWIRDRVAENTPWDAFVRALVTVRGSSIDEGASNFYAVHQDPESMAENVSQAFLGLSIGCARCHNHPLEKWTNDQYYAFANLFARVRAKGWGGDARNGDGRRTLYVEPAGDLVQPRTGRPQPPAPLDAPPLDAGDTGDRREALARWLTSPENPYFTRAVVNRVWAHYMGVGLVEPVDDLRLSNPASNEALLQGMADRLIRDRYDLKALMRSILVSHAYRRSSEALPENRDESRYYARFYPRRLAAEVLNDAIADVTGVRERFTEIALNDGSAEKTTAYPEDTRSIQLRDAAVKSYFLRTFGRHQREITCECERSNQPNMVQALHLANGSAVNDKLSARESRVTQILATDPPPARVIDEAWMRCFARVPTDAERKPFEEWLGAASPAEKRGVVEDLYWALLTSREFLFQH